MVNSPYLVRPGKKLKLSKCDPDDTGPYKDEDHAQPDVQANLKQLDKLQEVLYAQGKYSVLIVFQAMDAGGKDGAIEHIFSGINPQGCSVASFHSPPPYSSAGNALRAARSRVSKRSRRETPKRLWCRSLMRSTQSARA